VDLGATAVPHIRRLSANEDEALQVVQQSWAVSCGVCYGGSILSADFYSRGGFRLHADFHPSLNGRHRAMHKPDKTLCERRLEMETPNATRQELYRKHVQTLLGTKQSGAK